MPEVRKRYVIIGNGMAGISAAQEIRKLDANGKITLISDEGEPYYYRASLSEWIYGDLTDDMLLGRTEAFYKELHFDQITGHVTHVDPDAKTVTLKDEQSIPYDRLLIATGGVPNTFPIEGLEPERVYVFRTWEHARQIKEQVGCCGRVLILGGGILGLELAGALIKLGGRQVAVVQILDFMGGPLLDKPAGEWIQEHMQTDGVDLFLNDTVERVEEDTAYFKSGKTWEFNLFVQSVGIRPTFPEVPGLEVGRGIRINEACHTNLHDIYAAGDCTETYKASADRWFTTRIWLDCARQGKIAAKNMVGQASTLETKPFFNASIIYDTHYSYIGEPHVEGGEVYLWRNNGGYRKIRVVDGKLAGALLLGNRNGTTPIYHAIGEDVGRFGDAVVRPDFPWNDITGQDWDYRFY